MDIDLEELAAMVALLRDAEFSEFRYEKGDLRIVIRRGTAGARDRTDVADPSSGAPPAPLGGPRDERRSGAAPLPGCEVVPAPLLGTFYRSPRPGEAPFVSIGDRVQPDTVVCIVEVMKLMNSVVAGRAGVVAAIHARDGELVEFGRPLFSISAAG